MNEHDRKEIMNLIKFKKILKGDKTMLDKKVFDETDKKVFDEVVTLLMLGAKIDGFEYKGYMLNPDKKHVDLIIEGLKKKEGYCPCRVQKIPENICCCTHFINDGDCCCKLWIKKED